MDTWDQVGESHLVSTEKHLLLKVELVGSEPNIWRHLSCPPHLPLSFLHDMIQIAMGWENSHLYEFSQGRERFGPPDDEFAGATSARDDSQIEVGELLIRKGSRLSYMYDFGDSWEHLITCEGKCDPSEDGAPQVRGGERACPPEDIGGLHGFSTMLRSLESRGGESERDEDEWFSDFDPAAFDREKTNDELRTYYLAFLSGEAWADPDDESEETSGVWDVPESRDDAFPIPLDEFEEPVLYDPNDSRGPDPARWMQLTEAQQLAAIVAYHGITGQEMEMIELHASAHAMVEHHLLSPGIPSARKALKRALDLDLSRHDAIHALSHIAISMITAELDGVLDPSRKGRRPSATAPKPPSEKVLDTAYEKFDVKQWLLEMEKTDG